MNVNTTQGAFTRNSALKTMRVHDMVGNETAFYVVRYDQPQTILVGGSLILME